jgi:hypothetical protein
METGKKGEETKCPKCLPVVSGELQPSTHRPPVLYLPDHCFPEISCVYGEVASLSLGIDSHTDSRHVACLPNISSCAD